MAGCRADEDRFRQFVRSEWGARVRSVARKLSVACGLAFAVLALAVGGAEAALRWSSRATAGASEDRLGIRAYRGPDFERERDPRGVRVIVVGDDSAYGRALPEEHTWPRQLEGLFARDGLASRVQVLNGAESDADSARALELAEARLLDFRPTWLVVCLGVEDVLRALEPPDEPEWWERTALSKALVGEAPRTTQSRLEALDELNAISRDRFVELRRDTQLHFGVRVARLVELAWTRRSYVLLIAPPWPGRETAPSSNALALDGPNAARRLYDALVDELVRISEQSDALFVDARGAARSTTDPADSREAATAVAQSVASTVHAALRQRLR
jgi:lysophospholipase L1-like esterase